MPASARDATTAVVPAAPGMSDSPATSGRADGAALVAVSKEADDYSRSVDGVALEAIRTGDGSGLSTVQATRVRDVIANSNTVGFPMAVYGTIGDDRVLAAAVRRAPSGARWCGIDISSGMVVIYGPGAEHTGANPAGLEFSFALVKADHLEERAGKLGMPLRIPDRGQVHALHPSAESGALHETLCGIGEMAALGVSPALVEGAVVNGVIAALQDDRRIQRIGARKAIDSRIVTRVCIDYAESIGRIPTVDELCQVAHVSERRLRTAFNDSYGMPPVRFFRAWGLNLARQLLLGADPRRGDNVTTIALKAGFRHLGRFAGTYRVAFGESPSATLNLARGPTE